MRRPLLVSLLVLLLLAGACAPQEPTWRVITHPDGPLFVGDWVSFEVLPPDEEAYRHQMVTLSFGEQVLGTATFASSGIGRRVQATFWWVWDTHSLKPGWYSLTFRLQDGTTWVERVRLHPAGRVPPPEPASWQERETACCRLYYISGTDAAKEIDFLAQATDAQARAVQAALNAPPLDRISIYFIPRLIGHGGFAWNALYLSYLQDSYAPGEITTVLHHEFVHAYDNRLGGRCRLSIFQEGLATLLTGGHYKPEPLLLRAAALLDLGWYLPMEDLVNDFYHQQHEIGYLQAAALVEYLRTRYGVERFDRFYRGMECASGKMPADVLEASLHSEFGLSLPELEADFRAYLDAQPRDSQARLDLETTVRYMDTLRRYQRLLDPSAYFLTAWLPNGEQMRQRGIVADFTRRPQAFSNRLLEGQLGRARQAWFAGDYETANRLLERINRLLDWLE